MFFDGYFTQNGSSAGILFITPQKYSISKACKILFPYTNNIAEYEALVNLIKLAIEWKVLELHIYGDSQLIINQINDTYQTRDEKMMPYKIMVNDLKKYFTFVSIQQIPKSANRAADAMATLASIPELEESNFHFEFLVEELHYPAYDSPESQIVYSIIGHDSSRYNHIYSYLCDQIIPENLTHNEKRNLTQNASRYVIVVNDLFR